MIMFSLSSSGGAVTPLIAVAVAWWANLEIFHIDAVIFQAVMFGVDRMCHITSFSASLM